MKKGIMITLVVIGTLVLGGCGNNPKEEFLGEQIENQFFFPAPEESFVGDPMPFYDEGKFQVFFLDDLRDGQQGYHPWSLYTTENLYDYEYVKEVILFADSSDEQDLALGTGSVIKDKAGLYHAFYTGHNDVPRPNKPKEAIMHATSTDLKRWNKIPEDTFDGSEVYSANDFRDPYVLYVEKEQKYWMLITTRKDERGIIVKYTSEDLKEWKDEGIFFENDMGTDSNLECPTLLQYKNKWYLFFSDQWSERIVHYRVSDKIDGEFECPKRDSFDADGFYAGRAETDGEKLYLFGWNGTKDTYMDDGKYAWAGNLVVHQLVQSEDGSLTVSPVDGVSEQLNHKIVLKPIEKTKSIKVTKEIYSFSGEGGELLTFNKLKGSYLIKGKIVPGSDGKFGFTFGLSEELSEDTLGNLNFVFDEQNNRIAFYNINDLETVEPQSVNTLNLKEMEEIPFTILISDSVVSLYIENECVITARMYDAQERMWGIFGEDAKITLSDLEVYK